MPRIGVAVQSLDPAGRCVVGGIRIPAVRGVLVETGSRREACRRQPGRKPIRRAQIRNGQLQVDDVLGRQSRDRGRPDVVDPGAVGRGGNPGGQPARVRGPGCPVLDQRRAAARGAPPGPGVALERHQSLGPQEAHRFCEVPEFAVIDEHDVAQFGPFVIAELGGHPRAGILLGEPPGDQPLHSDLRVRAHADHEVERGRGRGSGQQGECRSTTTASGAAASRRWANLARTNGCVMLSRRALAPWSEKTTAARAARSNEPSAAIILLPNSAATAARPGEPGATTSLASTSESMTTAPRSRSCAATVDLPDPMPPVTAMVINARPRLCRPGCVGDRPASVIGL